MKGWPLLGRIFQTDSFPFLLENQSMNICSLSRGHGGAGIKK